MISERFYFINIAQFSKKIYPLPGPPSTPTTLDLGSKSKSTLTILFALSSAKNHGGDRFQGKGLNTGLGLPCRCWAGVPPAQTFLNSNLVTPENFIQFRPSVQKLLMIFFNTEGQTHKLHSKQITPLPNMGTGGNFLYPIFLPSTKGVES